MLPSFHLLTQVLRWSWPTKRACRMFPHLPGARTCTSPIESPDERTAYANGNARMHDTGGEIFSCGPRPSRCENPNKRKKSLVKFRIIHNPFFVPPLVRHSVHLPGRGRAKAMPKSMISNCKGLLASLAGPCPLSDPRQPLCRGLWGVLRVLSVFSGFGFSPF